VKVHGVNLVVNGILGGDREAHGALLDNPEVVIGLITLHRGQGVYPV
jgi:hypothetical protein